MPNKLPVFTWMELGVRMDMTRKDLYVDSLPGNQKTAISLLLLCSNWPMKRVWSTLDITTSTNHPPQQNIRINTKTPDVRQERFELAVCKVNNVASMNRKQEGGSLSHSALDGFTQAQTGREENGDYSWTPHLFLAEIQIRQARRASQQLI
jgi:hypothetical protein